KSRIDPKSEIQMRSQTLQLVERRDAFRRQRKRGAVAARQFGGREIREVLAPYVRIAQSFKVVFGVGHLCAPFGNALIMSLRMLGMPRLSFAFGLCSNTPRKLT